MLVLFLMKLTEDLKWLAVYFWQLFPAICSWRSLQPCIPDSSDIKPVFSTLTACTVTPQQIHYNSKYWYMSWQNITILSNITTKQTEIVIWLSVSVASFINSFNQIIQSTAFLLSRNKFFYYSKCSLSFFNSQITWCDIVRGAILLGIESAPLLEDED